VSGTVDIWAGTLAMNAAGIITQTTQPGFSVGQTIAAVTGATSPGQPSGSLLIGNSTLGFFPLFSANAANGLGSANPPTNLSLSGVTLSSIFTNVGFRVLLMALFFSFVSTILILLIIAVNLSFPPLRHLPQPLNLAQF